MSAPGASPVADAFNRDGLKNPDLYIHKIDVVRSAALVVRLSRAVYREASFLDDRILTAKTEGAWVGHDRAMAAAKALKDSRPLHFIFHAGHVGSTLVSRLLEEGGNALAIREPLPLRTLAEMSDTIDEPSSLWSPADLDAAIAVHLKLWARGYPETEACIVKATSTASRLGARLLAAAPAARAIYLNLAPEPFLAALLAGESSPFDLRGHAGERVRRLARLIKAPAPVLHALSLGELAAMSWLAERLTQKQLTEAHGERLLSVDFDAFLADIPATTAGIARHLGIELPPACVASLTSNPLLARYAKATEHAYSPALRAEILAQSRAQNRAEIAKGLSWLNRLATSDSLVGAVMS